MKKSPQMKKRPLSHTKYKTVSHGLAALKDSDLPPPPPFGRPPTRGLIAFILNAWEHLCVYLFVVNALKRT